MSRTPQRKKAKARRRMSPRARPVEVDRGPPETQARRRALIGASADPTLAVDPIGVLMARGHLGADARLAEARLRAGRRFGELRGFVFGAMTPRETLLQRVGGGGGSYGLSLGDPFSPQQTKRDQVLESHYRRALAALERVSRKAYRACVHLCHWRVLPAWSQRAFAGHVRPGDDEAGQDLWAGLDALAEAFGYLRRRDLDRDAALC